MEDGCTTGRAEKLRFITAVKKGSEGKKQISSRDPFFYDAYDKQSLKKKTLPCFESRLLLLD